MECISPDVEYRGKRASTASACASLRMACVVAHNTLTSRTTNLKISVVEAVRILSSRFHGADSTAVAIIPVAAVAAVAAVVAVALS